MIAILSLTWLWPTTATIMLTGCVVRRHPVARDSGRRTACIYAHLLAGICMCMQSQSYRELDSKLTFCMENSKLIYLYTESKLYTLTMDGQMLKLIKDPNRNCLLSNSREWSFGAALVLFCGGSPWSSAAERPSSSRLQVLGAAGVAVPRRRPSRGGSGC